MEDELARLDATAQAELVARKEITPLELVDAAIARVERLNPQLNAVILPTFEGARERARSRDLPHGSFRGVPFLLKDIGAHYAGEPLHAGMRFLRDLGWVEKGDTYFADKLRAAGFLSLGKTNTPELALLPTTEPDAYGATRNPWDRERSAGGSSGGAGAAVAAGMVAVAHASDGGGSIRIPASHCGLVGLKPSRGRCSFGPDLGERWGGFSVEHFVTRSVRDSAAILDVVAGPMPGDPYVAPPPARPFAAEVGAPLDSLRIGLMRVAPNGFPVHPECVAAAERAAAVLARRGHRIEESYPQALLGAEIMQGYVTVVATATARALDALAEKTGRSIGAGDVEPLTWAIAEMGRGCAGKTLLAAQERLHAASRRIAAWWRDGFDLLLTPTCGEPPPRLGEFGPQADNPLAGFLRAAPFGTFTAPFNTTGQPAISLPVHQSAEGLPVGAHLVAAYGREDLLLSVAAQLEEDIGWAQRRPPTL
jgi:amidase